MPVVIATKSRYSGTVTPPDLNVETTVIEVAGADDDYIVEGWLDLGNLASGDSVVIREYVAIDGVNYRLFTEVRIDGPVREPAIRFHTKQLSRDMMYKVTITQVSGTPRSFPYKFIVEVMGTV
jgi:hypothetical protein